MVFNNWRILIVDGILTFALYRLTLKNVKSVMDGEPQHRLMKLVSSGQTMRPFKRMKVVWWITRNETILEETCPTKWSPDDGHCSLYEVIMELLPVHHSGCPWQYLANCSDVLQGSALVTIIRIILFWRLFFIKNRSAWFHSCPSSGQVSNLYLENSIWFRASKLQSKTRIKYWPTG